MFCFVSIKSSLAAEMTYCAFKAPLGFMILYYFALLSVSTQTDSYGCRHQPTDGVKNHITALKTGSILLGTVKFSQKIMPSGSFERFLDFII